MVPSTQLDFYFLNFDYLFKTGVRIVVNNIILALIQKLIYTQQFLRFAQSCVMQRYTL